MAVVVRMQRRGRKQPFQSDLCRFSFLFCYVLLAAAHHLEMVNLNREVTTNPDEPPKKENIMDLDQASLREQALEPLCSAGQQVPSSP